MVKVERIVVYSWVEVSTILNDESTVAKLVSWPYGSTDPIKFTILKNVEV